MTTDKHDGLTWEALQAAIDALKRDPCRRDYYYVAGENEFESMKADGRAFQHEGEWYCLVYGAPVPVRLHVSPKLPKT